jgi:hypothetical protein
VWEAQRKVLEQPWHTDMHYRVRSIHEAHERVAWENEHRLALKG